MYFEKKQEEIENAVYSAIDEIADEFQVRVESYPEVHWIGGKLDPRRLALNKHHLRFLKEVKKLKSSCTFGRSPIIFIVEDSRLDVAEEAAHYVHFAASGVKTANKTARQQKSLRIVAEAIAFLGTKFIIPERKNVFAKYPDMFYMDGKAKLKVLEDIAKNEKPSRAAEYFVYQQGYGLGERMFYAHLEGKMSKAQIKGIVTSNLGKGYDADVFLARLKLSYWPPQNLVEFMRNLVPK